MDEMRVWDGVNESSEKKLMRSTWVGHVQQTGDEKLAKRAGAQKVEGKMEARTTDVGLRLKCLRKSRRRIENIYT